MCQELGYVLGTQWYAKTNGFLHHGTDSLMKETDNVILNKCI